MKKENPDDKSKRATKIQSEDIVAHIHVLEPNSERRKKSMIWNDTGDHHRNVAILLDDGVDNAAYLAS